MNIIEKLKNSEQTVSLALGIIVVLIVGGWAFYSFKGKTSQILPKNSPIPAGEVSEEGTATTKGETNTPPTKYKIQPGDSLWKIADKFYHSGYNWVDIAKANHLRSPNMLFVGVELSIPNVEARQPVTSVVKQGVGQTIEGNHYVVKKGDSLSRIALKAYGDMFAWKKIYEANKDKVQNPVLIYEGQTLTIPR